MVIEELLRPSVVSTQVFRDRFNSHSGTFPEVLFCDFLQPDSQQICRLSFSPSFGCQNFTVDNVR